MTYEYRNGLPVIKSGWIVIEGIRHYVNNFYVACNSSLNHSAWNITEKEKDCEICLKRANSKPIQLELFPITT